MPKFPPIPEQAKKIALFAMSNNASFTQSKHTKTLTVASVRKQQYNYMSYVFNFSPNVTCTVKTHELHTYECLLNQMIHIECVDGTLHISCKDKHSTHGIRFDIYNCNATVKPDTLCVCNKVHALLK